MVDEELLERVEKLERENRRMRRLGGVALVLAAALSAIYATSRVPEKIMAHEFDVVDGSGNVRIRLSAQKDGSPGVTLLDGAGVAQVAITVSQWGPSIDLGLRKTPSVPGIPRGATFSAISIADYHGGPAIARGPGIVLAGGALVGPSLQVAVTPSGRPAVVLIDRKGEDRASMSLLPSGEPDISFSDESGRQSVRLMALENGASLEFLGRKDQKIGKFSFPVDRMQLSTWGLYFDDKDGNTAVALGGINPGKADSPTPTLTLQGASPLISLSDRQGYSMDLGSTGVVAPTTGTTERTSASSIVMFGNDKKHHVIWRAP